MSRISATDLLSTKTLSPLSNHCLLLLTFEPQPHLLLNSAILPSSLPSSTLLAIFIVTVTLRTRLSFTDATQRDSASLGIEANLRSYQLCFLAEHLSIHNPIRHHQVSHSVSGTALPLLRLSNFEVTPA